jgi:hypothetical protein
MGRSVFFAFFLLLVFFPCVHASEKPVKAGKKNAGTRCRAKTVVSRYPVIKLNKKVSEKGKSTQKSKRHSHSFPL